MESGRNLGGRAYLVSKLQGRGASRRRAVRIVNAVFRAMGLALRRGEYVAFPFGYLKAETRVSQRGGPGRPYTVEHLVDEEGERLLKGEQLPAWPPGWSQKEDKSSFIYRWDRALRQERKQRIKELKRKIAGERELVNK